MRDVTLVILNSLRINCHIRRPLNVFMVITSTISVHYRLHCVRINALRAFGIHALNAFLSYDIVCKVHYIT